MITGATQENYHRTFTSSDTSFTYTFDNWSFNQFLAQSFTFTNSGGKQVKKVLIELTAIVKKVGNGSGSQYIKPYLDYKGNSTGLTAMAFSTYNTTDTEVTKNINVSVNSSKIADGTDFAIHFTDNGTLSQIIEVVRIATVKFSVQY